MPKSLRSLRAGLAVLLAGGLAACAQGTVGTADLGSYDPRMLHYVADKGDLYTEVLGNPFDTPKLEVERAVTAAMYRAHFGPDIRFSTERDPENVSPYRVVVLLNPAPGVSAETLCREAARPSRPATAELRVMLAFCASDTRETSVRGRIAGVTSPHDPAFHGLIRQMTAQLLPPRNPNLFGGDDFDI